MVWRVPLDARKPSFGEPLHLVEDSSRLCYESQFCPDVLLHGRDNKADRDTLRSTMGMRSPCSRTSACKEAKRCQSNLICSGGANVSVSHFSALITWPNQIFLGKFFPVENSPRALAKGDIRACCAAARPG